MATNDSSQIVSGVAMRAWAVVLKWMIALRRFITKHNFALAVLLTVIMVVVGIVLGSSNNGVIPKFPVAH